MRKTWRYAQGIAQLGKKSRHSMSTNMRHVIDRLTEYEDTGLSPEHCAELAKAEHEGLLVKLPCKVRQDCYISNGKGKPAQKITVSRFVYDMWDDEWIVCAANDAGFYISYAYSTREEAEKALGTQNIKEQT